LSNGRSLEKIDIMSGDEETLLTNLFLQYAAMLKIYKLNKRGSKISFIETNGITDTIKYSRTFGNKIAKVISVTYETCRFNVQAYSNGN
jgi:hypothetical protein